MVDLQGSLEGVGLAAIVQLLSDLHETGRLHLRQAEWSAELDMADGMLVAATLGAERGTAALAACALVLDDAEFAFVKHAQSAPHTMALSPRDVRAVLQGAAPRGQSARTRVPSLDAVPRLVATSGHPDDQVVLERAVVGLLPLVDGRRSVRELGGERPIVDVLRGLSLLVDEGLVTFDSPREVPRVTLVQPPAKPPARDIPPAVARRMATLAGMSATATEPPEPPEPSEPWLTDPPGQPRPRPRPRLSRGPLVLVAGAALALLLLVAAVLTMPAWRPTELESELAAATLVPAPTSAPPAAALKPTAPPAPVALPTVPSPQAAPLIARALHDSRFAAGAQLGWVENPPYAAWTDGAYRLMARQAMRFVAVAAPVASPADVVVTATLRKTGGPPGGGYGVIVRDAAPTTRNGEEQNFDAYVFEVGDLGEFGVWRRDGDRWVDLIPWTRSAAVRLGGSPNVLSVRAVGPQFTFSINGVEVAQIEDDVLADGGVGIFAGGDSNQVALDRFVVEPAT